MSKLYLLLKNLINGKQFFKYTEYEMDKFKRKLQFSKKLAIIEDSREMILDYDK